MKSILYTIAAFAIAMASAENIISVTSPLTGTVYTAGTSVIISWVNPTVDTISKIVLAQGAATALQPVLNVAENVPATTNSYTWAIPADITPGDYALEFGTSPDLSYTGQFSIKAPAAAATSGPAESSSAAESSAESSSAAESSAAESSAAVESSAAPTSSAAPVSSAASVVSVAASSVAAVSSKAPAAASSSAAAPADSAAFKLSANTVGAMALVGAAAAALL
ncbi:hypothetical protein F4703DRAFT_1883286 [Phycomyces blakesleeanus]